MNWLHKLRILIYERKQIRIKFEIFSLIALEYTVWSLCSFKTLALGIGVSNIHFDNIISVSSVDVPETTLKQIDKINHRLFENWVGLLQLRQFSAQKR